MRAAILLGTAAALLSACGSSGPVREPAELTRIKAPEVSPRVVWNRSPGSGSGSIITGLRLSVEPDVVVTADLSGDIYALSPVDGRRLWRTRTRARVVSGPTVSGDLVLAGTLDAEVIALRRADGTELWRATVSSEVLAPPVAERGVVVARCGDGKLFGLSAETGARLWSFDRAVPALTLRGQSKPLIFGNSVFVGLDNGRIVALNLTDGQVLWEQVVAAPTGRTELERIVDVDAVPVLTDYGVYAVSYGGEMAAISIDDGRVAWRRPVRSYSGLALADDRIIVTDDEGIVWALDAQSGAAAWKQEGLRYRRLSPPVVVDGFPVVADFEGYVHWLSPADGRIVGRVRAARNPITAPPVVRDETLYVLDTKGRIAVVKATVN
jgi:outer membrane protein assembly factor BamB